jgi:hypothetical protein
MPFKCSSCGRVEERRLRRPPDCPTKELCDLRALEQAPAMQPEVEVAPRTALEIHREAALRMRAAVDAAVAADEAPVRAPAPRRAATLVVGDRRYELANETLLGRNGDIAYESMRGDLTISREHARVRCRAGVWSIENVARSGNTVRVGDIVLAFGAAVDIAPGRHQIFLGERFSLSIEVPQ